MVFDVSLWKKAFWQVFIFFFPGMNTWTCNCLYIRHKIYVFILIKVHALYVHINRLIVELCMCVRVDLCRHCRRIVAT